MGKPMAHLGCYHECPDKYGKKPHVGGRIVEGASSVAVGGIPVARVGDKVACRHCMDCLLEGVPSIRIEGQPVTRVGSMTTHAGKIVEGNPTVIVGDYSGSGATGGEAAESWYDNIDKAIEEVLPSSPAEYEPISTEYENPLTEAPPIAKGNERTTAQDQYVQPKVPQPKEKEYLIIEVMGKDHPKGHHFRIFDETNNIQQEWLEKQVQLLDCEESVLHKWDWTEQPRHNVWLEIETESGPPIRLPAINQASALEEQPERQKHVVFPVVPSTLISGVSFRQENPRHHVLCRSGYLYLFKGDELWRELEIEVTEDGRTLYRDVRLQGYRDADGQFQAGYREPTGVPLEEIWIPARLHGAWQTINAAYSESQWTGDRINFYQNRAGDRADRSTHVRLRLQEPDIANGTTSNRHLRESHVLAASILKPQRARNFIEESRFDRPEKFLLDVGGGYFGEVSKKALEAHQKQEAQGVEDPLAEADRPEMGALSSCLFKTLQELDPEREQPCELDWKAPEEAGDCTEAIRQRKIGLIRVDDHLYRIRYLKQRRIVGAWYAGAAVQRAKYHEHFRSATLVQKVFVPEGVGGATNPLHQYLSEMDSDGQDLLAKSLASSERRLAIEYLKDIQNDLLLLLNAISDSPIVDLFTHSGFDLAGAFNFASNLLQQLTKDPVEHDALSNIEDDHILNHGKKWIGGLMVGSQMPNLFLALFPLSKDINLEEPYEEREQSNLYPGSGRFCGSELSKIENEDIPGFSSLKTLDGLQVVKLAESNAMATLVTSASRHGAQALMTIHGSILSEIQEATEKVGLQNPSLSQVRKKIAEIDKENAKLRSDLDLEKEKLKKARLSHSIKAAEYKKEVVRLEERRAEIGLEKARIEQEITKIEKSAILTNMRLYSKPLEAMRSSLPQKLGKMTMMRLSKALQSDYLVVGLPGEYKAEFGKVYFGDIKLDGNPVASTNKTRAADTDIPSSKTSEVHVLVVPKTVEFIQVADDIAYSQTQLLAEQQRYQADRSRLPTSTSVGDFLGTRQRVSSIGANIDDVEATKKTLFEQVKKMENPGFRALNGPAVPVLLMVMEGINIRAAYAQLKETSRIQGEVRARAGILSAGLDAILSGATIASRFGYNAGLASRIVAPLAGALAYDVGGRLGALVARIFGGPLLIGSGLGVIFGFISAVVCFMDAAHAYRMGNTEAAIGHGLLGVGLATLGIAGIAGKGGLLVLGPIGWAVLSVALIGYGIWLIWQHSAAPFAVWMRNGPFGGAGKVTPNVAAASMEAQSHLKIESIAYHRLVSMISTPNVSVARLPPNFITRAATVNGLGSANAIITIDSPVSSILGDSYNNHVRAEARLRADIVEHSYMTSLTTEYEITESKFDKIAEQEFLNLAEEKPFVIGRQRSASGLKLYVKFPDSVIIDKSLSYDPKRLDVSFGWNLKIQVVANAIESQRQLVFPAPKPEDPLKFEDDVATHSAFDFDDQDQHFWYFVKT